MISNIRINQSKSSKYTAGLCKDYVYGSDQCFVATTVPTTSREPLTAYTSVFLRLLPLFLLLSTCRLSSLLACYTEEEEPVLLGQRSGFYSCFLQSPASTGVIVRHSPGMATKQQQVVVSTT